MRTDLKQRLLARIKNIQKRLKNTGCFFEEPVNLFYLTGLNLSCGKLLLSCQAALLLVDSRYLEAAQKEAPIPVELDHKLAISLFSKQEKIKSWQFDPQTLSYARYLQLESESVKCPLIPNTPLFEGLRSIKDKQEIVKMRASAALLWKGFLWIKRSLKEGISEQELAKQFTIFCLKEGAQGLAFEPIIAFGANSARPHHRAGKTRLKSGDLVLIDIGVVLDQYHSDMTRVLFFKKTDPDLQHLYALVKQAHTQALALCRPDMKLGKLDEAVREVFKKQDVESLFIHSLGHGIGLKTHEFPRIRYDGKDKDLLLKAGMVINIEPGLYQPGKGGVRYEDTICITETGYTNFYPEPFD